MVMALVLNSLAVRLGPFFARLAAIMRHLVSLAFAYDLARERYRLDPRRTTNILSTRGLRANRCLVEPC